MLLPLLLCKLFKSGTNVTLTNDSNSVKIDVPANGTIASGDTGIISGGSVFNETRVASNGDYILAANTAGQNLSALDAAIKGLDDGKADVDLGNIDATGKSVITGLTDVTGGTNVTVTDSTDANGKKTYTVNATANGTVASGDTGLISGGSVFGETRVASNGNYITAANTAAGNLSALDTALKNTTDSVNDLDALAIKYDNNTKAKATLGGASGTTLDNVADGTLSADSKEAVNGSQLYTTNQNLAQEITDRQTADTALSDRIGSVSADGTYIKASSSKNVSENLELLDAALKDNADAIDDINDALDTKANVDLDNITATGETVIKNNAKQAINVVGTNKATVTKTDVSGVDTYTVDVVADGTIAQGNTGLVDGGTVYDALQDQKDEIDDALDTKANKDASNVAANTADWGAAIGTGTVASGNGELVTGGTVYSALQAEARPAQNGNYITTNNTAGANLTALDTAIKAVDDGKANTNLSNITDAGKTVIQDATNVVSGDSIVGVTSATANGVKTYTVTANINANGQVASGDTGLVSGGTVYTEVRPASDGEYVKTAQTTGANLLALDGAIQDVEDTVDDINDALDGKANVALDNITDPGKTVVRDLAKEAVKVVNGTNTTVTEGIDGNAKTYAVNVTVDGQVASGNTGIVDGGTVYDALQDQKDAIDADLALKANKDASNVAANTADWGAAIGTGAVTSGNSELVKGGTVYDALQAEARPAQNGNYISTSNTAGANLSALDTAIKAVDDGKANTNLSNITDAGKTVIQDATNVVSGDSIISVTPATANGVKTYTVTANISADGQIADGNTGLVSGDTVFDEVRVTTDGDYVKVNQTTAENLSALDTAVKDNADDIAQINTDLTGKANVALDNITDAGKTVVRDLAKEAVKVVNGTNTTVTEGEDGVAKTYAVNVTVDGQIAENNTGIVDGGTVYEALKDQKDEITDALDTKANKDASNVADQTAKWGEAIGTGAVADSNGELVTGGTVYSALMNEARPSADGNYITATNTAGANLTALDTAVKANADNIAQINTDLSGKANISLDNINADGKDVITGLTDIATTGNYLTVSNAKDDDGKKTYTLGLTVDGTIADGNTGLVTGGDVYNAIQASNLSAGNNIEIVDNKINAIGLVKYDSLDNKNLVTLEGTRGTKVTNLKAASLTQTSTDAVIGAQLWATNTNIEGFARDIRTNSDNITALTTSVTNALNSVSAVSTTVDTVMDLAADKSLNNLSDTGKQVIANAAANAVQEYMRANGGNGGTTGSGLLGGSNSILSASAPRAMGFGLMANPTNTNNNEIVTNNDDLNNNDNTISPAVQDALDTKAEIADVEAGFADVDTKLADKADISYVDEGLAKKADADFVNEELGKKADLDFVNGELDKKADKTELDAKADKADLDEKANKDASNIDVAQWSDKLATGAVEEGNTGLVNGGVVFDAIQNISGNDMMKVDGNAIRIGGDVKYDEQDTIDVSKSDGSGRVITGVMTDANDNSSVANVGYVNAIGEGIIQGVNRGFSKLDDKINKTGAGAAALANLHPLDYDPDNKFNVSAAYGNYHGESAGALGVFYRPSEQVMINASSTIGNGNTMFGAGVTFAMDKPAASGLSKVQMAKTINQQSQVINAQAQELQNVKAELAEIRQMLQEKK